MMMMQPQARSCTSFPLEEQRGEEREQGGGLARSTHRGPEVEMFVEFTMGLSAQGLSQTSTLSFRISVQIFKTSILLEAKL